MSNGFTGAILRVNLTTGSIEEQKLGEQFYRMYMGGGAFGTYFLLKETSADTDALSTLLPSPDEDRSCLSGGSEMGSAASAVIEAVDFDGPYPPVNSGGLP